MVPGYWDHFFVQVVFKAIKIATIFAE